MSLATLLRQVEEKRHRETKNLKRCGHCKEIKNISEFYKDKHRLDGYKNSCKSCCYKFHIIWSQRDENRLRLNKLKREKNNSNDARAVRRIRYSINPDEKIRRSRQYYHNNKAEIRKRNILKLYGIDESTYNSILESQGGGCAICGKKNIRLAVDHCHKTGKVRGILCHTCNNGIGFLGDSISGLVKAYKYLKNFHEQQVSHGQQSF